MKEKSERPTKEEFEKVLRYWGFGIFARFGTVLYNDFLETYGDICNKIEHAKPKWPPEIVEKVRAWMREFDLVIRDGVPDGWSVGNCLSVADAYLYCSDCPIRGAVICNSEKACKMSKALYSHWGYGVIPAIRARRDELRAHLESVGLDWKTPEPIWKAITRLGEEAAKEHEPEAESETPVIGEGYRRLGIGEILRDGDTYYIDSSKNWHPTNFVGDPIGGSIYRRLREQKPETEKETCEGCAHLIKEPTIDEIPHDGLVCLYSKNSVSEASYNVGCQYKRPVATPAPERKFIRHSAEFLEDGKVKVQITAQSHRGKEFGRDGNRFDGSFRKGFESKGYPAVAMYSTETRWFVRGIEEGNDKASFVLPRQDYNAFLALCDEYNEFFSGEEREA